MDISGRLMSDEKNTSHVYIFDSEDIPPLFLSSALKGIILSGTYASNNSKGSDDWLFCVYHQEITMSGSNDDLRVIPINIKDPDKLLLVEAYRYVPVRTIGRKRLENLAQEYVIRELSLVPKDKCYVQDAYAALLLHKGNTGRAIPGFFNEDGTIADIEKDQQLHAVCYEFDKRRRVLHFPNDPKAVSKDKNLIQLLDEAQSSVPVLCPGAETLSLFKYMVGQTNLQRMPSDYFLG